MNSLFVFLLELLFGEFDFRGDNCLAVKFEWGSGLGGGPDPDLPCCARVKIWELRRTNELLICLNIEDAYAFSGQCLDFSCHGKQLGSLVPTGGYAWSEAKYVDGEWPDLDLTKGALVELRCGDELLCSGHLS